MKCISFERSAPLALNENTKKFFEIPIKENLDDSEGVFVTGAASRWVYPNSRSINLSKLEAANNLIYINISKLDDFKDILDFYEFKNYSPLKEQQNFYKFSISIFTETHHRKFYNTTLTKVNEDLMSLEIHYYYFNEFPLSNSEIRELKLENRQSKLNDLLNK
jgi:hypothetical protein